MLITENAYFIRRQTDKFIVLLLLTLRDTHFYKYNRSRKPLTVLKIP